MSSATATAAIDHPVDDRLARRNIFVLAFAQALAGGNQAVLVTTGGIIGAMLAPHKGLATVPISIMVIGMWLGTLPIGALARRYGRRPSLIVGALAGSLAGVICSIAILQGSFGLFLLGAFCAGIYAASHHAYRFAATDTASAAFRPKAVSWVLAGGVAAAIVGPQLIIFTKDYWPPYLFSVTFLCQGALAALAAVVLLLLKIPRPPPLHETGSGRPLGTVHGRGCEPCGVLVRGGPLLIGERAQAEVVEHAEPHVDHLAQVALCVRGGRLRQKAGEAGDDR